MRGGDGWTPEERKRLAERWRLLGEKLRTRSPGAFQKLVEMLTASDVDADIDSESDIDQVYLIH